MLIHFRTRFLEFAIVCNAYDIASDRMFPNGIRFRLGRRLYSSGHGWTRLSSDAAYGTTNKAEMLKKQKVGG